MIGISPGTRSIGIAVIKDGTLIDWGVKVFNGVWSEDKLYRIINVLRSYFIRYDISTIAIKRNHPAKNSEGVEEVMDGLMICAKKLGLKYRTYTMEELKRRCNGVNKKSYLSSYIFQQYPEVESTIEFTKKNFSYHMKTIEAVALAHVVSK